MNREKVFEVYAQTPAGEPVADLPGDLRWRVAHLQTYVEGSWKRDGNVRLQLAERAVIPISPAADPFRRLPDLGPDAIYLTFLAGPRLGRNQPLADPVAWKSAANSPVVGFASRDGPFQSWNQRPDGTFDGLSVTKQYVQAWVRPADFDQSPVLQTAGPPAGLNTPPTGLWALKTFAEDLLRRLVAETKLPPAALADRDPATGATDPARHAAIAKAMSDHFAHSGEFAYTLELTRKDKLIDPVEDFVLNTKAGHCQRFASALALTLRCLGISSRLVLGYRGLESRDDGWYDVREDHAHAWVEVLVPDTGPRLPPPRVLIPGAAVAEADLHQYRWLIVDPTPGGAETVAESNGGLFDRVKEQWNETFKALLLAYNADSREKTAEATRVLLVDDRGWLLLVLGAAGVFAGRRLVKRWRVKRAAAVARAAVPAYVLAMYDLLARHGTVRPPGQTPLEFAVEVADRLRGNPATAGVADVPVTLTEAYYAERFGLRPLSAAGAGDLMAEYRRLEAAVTAAGWA